MSAEAAEGTAAAAEGTPAAAEGSGRRGRPPGSKNKGKLYFLEVMDGGDIIEELRRFASRLNQHLSVISINGCATDVTVHVHNKVLSNAGAQQFVSVNGIVVPKLAAHRISLHVCFFSKEHPYLSGGRVEGSMIAHGKVLITLSSFGPPSTVAAPTPPSLSLSGPVIAPDMAPGSNPSSDKTYILALPATTPDTVPSRDSASAPTAEQS